MPELYLKEDVTQSGRTSVKLFYSPESTYSSFYSSFCGDASLKEKIITFPSLLIFSPGTTEEMFFISSRYFQSGRGGNVQKSSQKEL